MQGLFVVDQMHGCRVEFFQAAALLCEPAVEVWQVMREEVAECGDALRIRMLGIKDDTEEAEERVVFDDQYGQLSGHDFCSGSMRSARATRVCML